MIIFVELNARAQSRDHESSQLMLEVGTNWHYRSLGGWLGPRALRNPIKLILEASDELNVLGPQYIG